MTVMDAMNRGEKLPPKAGGPPPKNSGGGDKKPTSVVAALALIFGVLGLYPHECSNPVFVPLAFLFAIIGMAITGSNSSKSGRGVAATGLLLSVVGAVVFVFIVVIPVIENVNKARDMKGQLIDQQIAAAEAEYDRTVAFYDAVKGMQDAPQTGDGDSDFAPEPDAPAADPAQVFLMANNMLLSDSATTVGNNALARSLAGSYRKMLLMAADSTDTPGISNYGLQVYCHLTDDACIFIILVPEPQPPSSDLQEIMWMAGRISTEGESLRLGAALRGPNGYLTLLKGRNMQEQTPTAIATPELPAMREFYTQNQPTRDFQFGAGN